MTDAIAAVVVALAGLYFAGLGAASLLYPARASRFLLGFAGSPRVHYIELLLRLMVGAALIVHAPRMPYAPVFGTFGWLLVTTTAILLVAPWRWHRHFAQLAVPMALPYIALIGLASMLLGGVILAAFARVWMV